MDDNPLLNEPEPSKRRHQFPFIETATTTTPKPYLDFLETTPRSRPNRLSSHLINTDTIIPIITSAPNYSSSLANLLTGINKTRRRFFRRSQSAPCLISDDVRETFEDSLYPEPKGKSTPYIVKQTFLGVIIYAIIVGTVYTLKSDGFKASNTFKPVDAMYFTVVTLCTIGYGDIVPNTTFTKLFTCGFILVGFGFIDILLNGLVTYVLDRQEAILLGTVEGKVINSGFGTYMIDTRKGRMRIRIKVGLALAVVVGCIAIGTIMVRYLEKMSWVDSFYLSVTSVTTVGYGDYAFETLAGRCFAIVWLLISTLAVARAFLYLTELRIDKRNRRIAKWVLQRKMTVGDLVAADLDHDGSISKSEFILYKLKEMGKVGEKDITLICNQFDMLDNSHCGRLTVSDLMETAQN